MKIELNKKQTEAFKELEKAFKKCEKLKITYYAVLGSLMPINGNYIKSVCNGSFRDGEEPLLRDIINIGEYYLSYPTEFADDEMDHYAVLTEKGIKRLAKENEDLS